MAELFIRNYPLEVENGLPGKDILPMYIYICIYAYIHVDTYVYVLAPPWLAVYGLRRTCSRVNRSQRGSVGRAISQGHFRNIRSPFRKRCRSLVRAFSRTAGMLAPNSPSKSHARLWSSSGCYSEPCEPLIGDPVKRHVFPSPLKEIVNSLGSEIFSA